MLRPGKEHLPKRGTTPDELSSSRGPEAPWNANRQCTEIIAGAHPSHWADRPPPPPVHRPLTQLHHAADVGLSAPIAGWMSTMMCWTSTSESLCDAPLRV
jgi:hypothetical protein